MKSLAYSRLVDTPLLSGLGGEIGAIRLPSGRYRVPEGVVGKILDGGSD